MAIYTLVGTKVQYLIIHPSIIHFCQKELYIMNRIVAFILFSLFSFSAMANGWCDSRPTQAARQACYNSLGDTHVTLANMAIRNMHLNYEAISKSPTIPADEKQQFLAGVRISQKNIDAGCTNNRCITNSVAQLNNRMAAFYYKYYDVK